MPDAHARRDRGPLRTAISCTREGALAVSTHVEIARQADVRVIVVQPRGPLRRDAAAKDQAVALQVLRVVAQVQHGGRRRCDDHAVERHHRHAAHRGARAVAAADRHGHVDGGARRRTRAAAAATARSGRSAAEAPGRSVGPIRRSSAARIARSRNAGVGNRRAGHVERDVGRNDARRRQGGRRHGRKGRGGGRDLLRAGSTADEREGEGENDDESVAHDVR